MAPRPFKNNSIILRKTAAILFPSTDYALKTGVLDPVLDNNDWLRWSDPERRESVFLPIILEYER
jgi:hypothetical protein